MNLGDAVKERMNEKKISVKALSSLTGIAPTTLYSFFQRGGDGLSISSFLKIAQVLEISADELYARSKNDPHLNPLHHSEIHANIKKMRQFRNISQKELAEQLNVAQNTISSWETGRTEPNLGAIDDLCRVFQCQKSDLLDFIVEEPRKDIYLKITVENSGKTNTTVLNGAPVHLTEYWAQLLELLSDDSLKKLANRANELAEIDRLKNNLNKKTKK